MASRPLPHAELLAPERRHRIAGQRRRRGDRRAAGLARLGIPEPSGRQGDTGLNGAQEARGLAGTIASGRVAVGDPIVVCGSGRTALVSRIVAGDGDLPCAAAGRSVTLTLSEELDVIRGDMLAEPKDRPVVTRRLAADIVWMADDDAAAGPRLLLKGGTQTVPATITQVVDQLALDTLARTPAERLPVNAIGRMHLETAQPVAFDPYAENRETGAFILIDRTTLQTVGAGMARNGLDRATNVHHQAETVTAAMRAESMRQLPLVAWLTGLPASGKSTIANLVEARLAAAGRHTMLLDGDNLRQGLNADLGFDPGARSENVRRVGEVAKLRS